MRTRVSIDKIENGYVVAVPAKDADGKYIEYTYLDFAYDTLDMVIEKVKEVYGE